MATTSNIAIILRPEDRNRNFNVMDEIFDDYRPDMQCPWCRSEKDEYLEDIFPNCEPNGNAVLQIYCHNDGYPEGVGYALLKGYNSYEKALALILGGDLSSLYKSYSCPYSLGKGEDPIQCAPDVLEKAEIKGCYLYVFDYETDKWLIQKYGSELKPLEDALK